MLPTVLIVVGTILVGFGVIGIIALSFEPLVKAFRVVFLRDVDYYVYDSDRGRITLEKEYRILRRGLVFVIVIGTIMLGTGLFLKYTPRGNDLLTSEDTEGVTKGDDEADNMPDIYDEDSGKYVSNDGTQYSYCIVISGTTIGFNHNKYSDVNEFEQFLCTLDRGHTILLIDDFAVLKTYKSVTDLLDYYGMNYEEEVWGNN